MSVGGVLVVSQMTPMLTLIHATEEPIAFYGPPAGLRGALRVRNDSDEKVKLTDLTLEAADEAATILGLRPSISIRARLQPKQETRIAGLVQLDPTTPPGTYHATLAFGDRRQRVAMHVTEQIELRVRPQRVFIFTEGPREFERQFVLENTGNVPLDLGNEWVMHLTESIEIGSALRRGLPAACEAQPDTAVKAFLCALAHEEPGDLTVLRERLTLQPGETRVASMRFQLPQKLQNFRRYVVTLPLCTAEIEIEVLTGRLGSAPS